MDTRLSYMVIIYAIKMQHNTLIEWVAHLIILLTLSYRCNNKIKKIYTLLCTYHHSSTDAANVFPHCLFTSGCCEWRGTVAATVQ